MRFRLSLAGFLVASALAAGCGGFVDPANNVSETFTGTIPAPTIVNGVSVLGFAVSRFTVSKNGEFFVTLDSLTPPLPNNLPTEVLITAEAGGDCVAALQQLQGGHTLNAIAGKQVLSGVITPAKYCLWIFDEGDFSGPETFSITIKHP